MGTYCIGCPREGEQDGRVGRKQTGRVGRKETRSQRIRDRHRGTHGMKSIYEMQMTKRGDSRWESKSQEKKIPGLARGDG